MKNNTERNGYNPMPLCDSHIHIHYSDQLDLPISVDDTCAFIKNLMEYFSFDRLNIQALTPHGPCGIDYTINLKALYCKAKLNSLYAPTRQVYANANLIHVFNTSRSPDFELMHQARKAYEAGCDGFKLLDGKPGLRKQLGYGINDSRYEQFLQYAEVLGIPIVLHTCDPHEQWGEWVDDAGQKHPKVYDSSFATLQQLRDELEEMLEYHPNLKLILAHFYFWAGDLDKFSAFLDRHPNVYFDIVPASEEYFDLNKDTSAAREFFIKYSDRILYGSDSENWHWSDDLNQYEHNFSYPINLSRNFLEGKQPFRFVDNDRGEIIPLQLEDKYLKKIYHDNFVKLYGEKPRPVVRNKVLELLHELYPIYNDPSKIVLPNIKENKGLEITKLASRDKNLMNLTIMSRFFKNEF